MGHILNLVVQAFLFNTGADEIEMASYDQQDIQGTKANGDDEADEATEANEAKMEVQKERANSI